MNADIIDQLVQNDFAQDKYNPNEYTKVRGDHYVSVVIEDYDPTVRVRRYKHDDTQIGSTENFRVPTQMNQLLTLIAR